MTGRIKRLLVANRGEIAVRVIRAARALGVETVAVYSSADAQAMHVREADTAVAIGAAPASASYLNIDALIAAAQDSGADAVHPGYGFLSENAAFARAVADAGLVFIGPDAGVIEKMGDKRAARLIAKDAGVPVVPGFDGDDTDADKLLAEAKKIGFPLMIKATAGGGGRGLRRVETAADFMAALESARREAGAAFGNTAVMLEKLITNARHVEVQILADTHGTTLHVGERDCSAQRRHQKVIEEAPCPTISDKTRAGLLADAVKLSETVGYSGAGTVEFLVGEDGSYYFLEMNTRLQVEHPVTELVTGLDLVAEQIRIAAGAPLTMAQEDITVRGHAVEARLYAERAHMGFMPQTGTLLRFDVPICAHTRLDTGVESGDTVTAFYDPMLAKLIAWGETRADAVSRLQQMIGQSHIAGVTTNKGYLSGILTSDAFARAEHRTHTLDGAESADPLPPAGAATAVAAVLEARAHAAFALPELAGWRTLHTYAQTRVLELDGERFALALTCARERDGWHVCVQNAEAEHRVFVQGETITLDGRRHTFALESEGDHHHLDLGFTHVSARDITHAPAKAADAAGSGRLTAPMDGQVVAVGARVGETVAAGDLIVVIEAMKMEHRVCADIGGTLKELTASVGDQVKSRAALAVIEPGEDA
jgi:geranyl-CoA carboxylase alpha subunit